MAVVVTTALIWIRGLFEKFEKSASIIRKFAVELHCGGYGSDSHTEKFWKFPTRGIDIYLQVYNSMDPLFGPNKPFFETPNATALLLFFRATGSVMISPESKYWHCQ